MAFSCMYFNRAILGRVALKNSGSSLTADVFLHSGKDLFSGVCTRDFTGWLSWLGLGPIERFSDLFVCSRVLTFDKKILTRRIPLKQTPFWRGFAHCFDAPSASKGNDLTCTSEGLPLEEGKETMTTTRG